MKLLIKKLDENAMLPKRATSQSAGADLCACIDSPVTIQPGEIKMLSTGISVEPDDKSVAMLVFARSSLASRHGIALANSVGVIDSDYRGEIKIPLINSGSSPYEITPGERIAQLVVTPVIFPEIEETRCLSDTERGEGGFGSTGKL
ncbi:MAG: dUTP diphosphatase [Oscillospiraceae bacterium]|jgi:dUTP pyrophosphatase